MNSGQHSRLGKTQVLVVDDSAVMRQLMTSILQQDPTIRVTTASDPIIASGKIARDPPQVILLDIEMPRMDGLTFLRQIMSERPTPVVICSHAARDPEVALNALRLGAVEVISKPQLGIREFVEESAIRFIDVLKAAARASVDKRMSWEPRAGDTISSSSPSRTPQPSSVPPASVADSVVEGTFSKSPYEVIAIGVSTGGPQALSRFLPALPRATPCVLIVQHMPAFFTGALANRLNDECTVDVVEARQGQELRPGLVLISPGDRHLSLRRSGRQLVVQLLDGPLVSRHRPSVDVLFHSVAEVVGSKAVGVIMTGMGSDGVAGLGELRSVGALTAAQDELSSVVYGMPKAAVERGAVGRQLGLSEIAPWLVRQTLGTKGPADR